MLKKNTTNDFCHTNIFFILPTLNKKLPLIQFDSFCNLFDWGVGEWVFLLAFFKQKQVTHRLVINRLVLSDALEEEAGGPCKFYYKFFYYGT